MARQRRASPFRQPTGSSKGRKTRAANGISAPMVEDDPTGLLAPPTLRRSSRIREARVARQRAADATNAQSRDPDLPVRPSDPTFRGLLAAGTVLESLLDYLNDALRHPQVRARFSFLVSKLSGYC